MFNFIIFVFFLEKFFLRISCKIKQINNNSNSYGRKYKREYCVIFHLLHNKYKPGNIKHVKSKFNNKTLVTYCNSTVDENHLQPLSSYIEIGIVRKCTINFWNESLLPKKEKLTERNIFYLIYRCSRVEMDRKSHLAKKRNW